jgi:hypothetical protein
MNFIDMLKMRRSVYKINNQLPVFENKVIEIIEDAVKYVPDAFNMKSQRILVLFDKKHKEFWNGVYNELVAVTGGKISRDKIDSFGAGFGTILYFYDKNIVDEYKKNFPLYADNFDNWAIQSNAMLQFAIWTAFASIEIGASLQHYNPVIDNMVHNMFDIPNNWVLNAQMPFGGITEKPAIKPQEDILQRIKFIK